MKWLKHDSDAHDNLKFQELLSQYKMMGYGVWWICCELVAQNIDGKRPIFSISKKKNWLKKLKMVSGISLPTLERILQVLAESDLISKKALKIGTLSIPQMKDRSDEYTDKVARDKRHSREGVGIKSPLTEQKRTEQKRTDNDSLISSNERPPNPEGLRKLKELKSKFLYKKQ